MASIDLIKGSDPQRFEWSFQDNKETVSKSDVRKWIVALRKDSDKVKLGKGTMTTEKVGRLRVAVNTLKL